MTTPATRAAAPLPLWLLPFVLALLALSLVLGKFGLAASAAAAASTCVAVGYGIWAARRRRTAIRPVANLLALLPGHLLILFGLGTLSRPDLLALVWCALPVGSALYDVASARTSFCGRASILSGLYGILWLVVFFLLERLIVEGKGITGHAAIVTAVAFGAIGVLFVVTGTMRHLRAVKE